MFEAIFPKQLTDAIAAVQATGETVAKVAGDDLARILEAIDLGRYEAVKADLERILRQMASDRALAAARGAATAANATADQLERMLSQANADAIAWAERHAAELITEITDTTAREIRELITTGVQEGATNDELSDALRDHYAFSKTRSDLIARTETSFAENRGTLDGWKASGVVAGKEVLPDVDPCPVCQANADQGVIALDANFLSGDPGPPFHPNCECSILAAVVED